MAANGMSTENLVVYFDASCPLCKAEMLAIKAHDHADCIELRDCSAPGFSDADAERAQVSRSAMMQLIHARTADQRWLIGVDVFVEVYRRVGMTSVANFWSHPWLSPLLRKYYPFIARHRMLLSRLGFNAPYGWLVHWAAKRAAKRSAKCKNAVCELPTADDR